MKKFKIGSLVALLLGLVLFTGLIVNADEFRDIGSLYDKAVNENIIDPNLYPKANWEKDEISTMRPSYEEYKNYDSSITYELWLKLNKYGVMADTKEPVLQLKTPAESNIRLGTAQDNIDKFCRDTQAGDILVVGGDFPTGVLGHAAILNADGYVLEIPGGSNWAHGIPDNNRQLPKRQWITEHIKEWTSVYRIKDTNLARQIAKFVDTHYYSTTGSATKDIHLDYLLDWRIKLKNPNYCSKLVWQAYYYGSGSLPVMKEVSSTAYIVPTALPNAFDSRYAPYFVGKY